MPSAALAPVTGLPAPGGGFGLVKRIERPLRIGCFLGLFFDNALQREYQLPLVPSRIADRCAKMALRESPICEQRDRYGKETLSGPLAGYPKEWLVIVWPRLGLLFYIPPGAVCSRKDLRLDTAGSVAIAFLLPSQAISR